MLKKEQSRRKINLIILLIVSIVLVVISQNFSFATEEIIPNDNQYFELKATTITDVEGQNKQVIMELWGYEIDFKRI